VEGDSAPMVLLWQSVKQERTRSHPGEVFTSKGRPGTVADKSLEPSAVLGVDPNLAIEGESAVRPLQHSVGVQLGKMSSPLEQADKASTNLFLCGTEDGQ
jgi:hypothetical protein